MDCTGSFASDVRAAYLAELTAALPASLSRVFLCNSGTEANEAAIKFARLSTGRPGIVAAMRGFHGRTLGALSATWDRHYKDPFAPLVPGFDHVPYDDLAKLDAAVTDGTAAVILEVVQGEGGVRPASAEYLRGAQALCRERGALLVLDEVQTGFGRTGRLFAFEHAGLEPDLLTLAKGMAGGFPMGACVIGARVAELPVGAHGSTFGGNPLACAAARAVLDVMRTERIPEHVAETGAYFLERLRALDAPVVREVRGLGFLIGLELKEKVAPYVQAMQDRGFLVLNAGATVLRMLPPLVLERAHVDEIVESLAAVLAETPA
jgi:acetylornithine/LysW-gamma-L-lysine aminotransferase